ncbi:hypothetical protein BCON_0148g00040 [Botryotinia convoluta]|uniref:Uncharacterized protein n=1 Tax=Botryotinia convoluta TaxID=54673 RepID=A0A4Z1I013_9HELO|nr:hypothetical protein BCON_0148g00040 [Botryotinia convoluta]
MARKRGYVKCIYFICASSGTVLQRIKIGIASDACQRQALSSNPSKLEGYSVKNDGEDIGYCVKKIEISKVPSSPSSNPNCYEGPLLCSLFNYGIKFCVKKSIHIAKDITSSSGNLFTWPHESLQINLLYPVEGLAITSRGTGVGGRGNHVDKQTALASRVLFPVVDLGKVPFPSWLLSTQDPLISRHISHLNPEL